MTADWIAVDWGTSRLRAWAMAADGRVLDQASSGRGMGGLTPEGFEAALLDLVSAWLPPGRTTPVIACGMVGARQGWTEAAYRPVPCPPLGPPLTSAPATDPRLSVRIVPGLSQLRPFDVIRGEETQIAGLLAADPGFDGTLCLPGTHSKWVRISAGEVAGFQTCMTGEIFALLATQSVLRHTVTADTADPAAFDHGLAEALARPEALTARLFALRAEPLLAGLPPEQARGRLSGLLIGVELAAMKAWWLGNRVVLVGAPDLTALYARALAAQGVTAETTDATALTLAGLTAARALEPA